MLANVGQQDNQAMNAEWPTARLQTKNQLRPPGYRETLCLTPGWHQYKDRNTEAQRTQSVTESDRLRVLRASVFPYLLPAKKTVVRYGGIRNLPNSVENITVVYA